MKAITKVKKSTNCTYQINIRATLTTTKTIKNILKTIVIYIIYVETRDITVHIFTLLCPSICEPLFFLTCKYNQRNYKGVH